MTESMEFHALTPERWEDMVTLFAHHGYAGSCWCMWWRMGSKQFDAVGSDVREMALHDLVDRGIPVGVIGYIEGQPKGWCSVAPRETYLRLERSPDLKRLDDAPVWSVVCFWVANDAREQGFTLPLLRAAVDYAISQGAQIIEAYPVEPVKDEEGKVLPKANWYMGLVNTFLRAGFVVVSVTKKGRKIVRYFKDPL